MKKVNLFLVGLVTMVTLSIGFLSCGGGGSGGNNSSGGDAPQYIGTWTRPSLFGGVPNGKTEEITFYKDGTAIVKLDMNYPELTIKRGTWTIGGYNEVNEAAKAEGYIPIKFAKIDCRAKYANYCESYFLTPDGNFYICSGNDINWEPDSKEKPSPGGKFSKR